MSDQPARDASPFDELLGSTAPAASASGGPSGDTAFTTVFRGYDKAEVDEAIADLTVRLRAESGRTAWLEERSKRAGEAQDQLSREAIERLEAEAAAANARAADAEQKVQALTEELRGATAEAGAGEGGGDSASRHQFEEILRVAEEQASLLIKNASVQGDRLLEAARAEIQNRRKEAQAEGDAIIAQAQHDAQQARLRIDTELTAHRSQLEREGAHAAEKVAQAEREAAAIRTEAEKGAAALRSTVARETELARAEAEEAVRDLRVRALEFEESLTRRQDDAQQEFLVLHNQAVAHAERITQDANDQVAASLEHAQRVSAKADDFDRLMRAQAQQTEADAQLRSREILDRAREKAQRIIDTVATHSQSVLRDAEDRTRQLRWQQHQLTSFMSEVKELIRPEGPFGAGEPVAAEEADGADAGFEPVDIAPEDVALDPVDGPAPDAVVEPESTTAIELITGADDEELDDDDIVDELDLDAVPQPVGADADRSES